MDVRIDCDGGEVEAPDCAVKAEHACWTGRSDCAEPNTGRAFAATARRNREVRVPRQSGCLPQSLQKVAGGKFSI